MEPKKLRIKLALDIDGADMQVLKKYGKVKEGITREVLVPADMNLHALHYVIQKAFGWQNSHLHHFLLPDEKYNQLTQNSFIKWADYCGIYFRFPTNDMEDLYWDDDYDESISIKTWFRKKYSGPYHYHGYSEHFMEARTAVTKFMDENKTIRVSPSFSEWIKMSPEEQEYLRTHPAIKEIEDVTCDEMQMYFMEAGGLNELLERLKLTEILGEKTNQLKSLVDDANKRFKENDISAYSKHEYFQKMSRLDAEALPLTNELIYEYDYGDGWKVNITLVDEDGCDVTSDCKNEKPLCIALDGLPVLDDVGGIGGYCEMLTRIHEKSSLDYDYDDSEEMREWARMQGWTGRMNKPDKLL